MIRLSKQEELDILHALNPANQCGEGSSRKVFEFNDKLVKIAIDEGGILQNKNEIYVAQNYPELVANIYAYGDLILVVEPLSFHNAYEWEPFIEEICDYGYEEDEFYDAWDEFMDCHSDDEKEPNQSRCRIAFELLMKANEVLGATCDNYQMGWSEIDNCFKLYDAGFFCNEDIKVASNGSSYINSNQVGSISEYTDLEAIEIAIETIENKDK